VEFIIECATNDSSNDPTQPCLSPTLRPDHYPIQPSDASGSVDRSPIPVGGISGIVIKKNFANMEPTIRHLFRDVPNVEVIVDRRWHERRGQQPQPLSDVPEKRQSSDRRSAVHMLEVLVNMAI
jgi:hypothetical protein